MPRPPLLIHLHIPKNAGTTVSRMIKAKLMAWPPSHVLHHGQTLGYYYLSHDRRLERMRSLTPRQKRRTRFFEAHGGFGLHEHLPEPSEYITMLREPIDRAISVYYYHRQHDRISETTSLETWLQTGDPSRIWYVDNAHVRYLAGDHGEIIDVPRGHVTRAMLDTALERLHQRFLLAGVTEMFDESMILLRRAMGWRHCAYGRSNVTRERSGVASLTPATRDLIREQNELDLELYTQARSLLTARIQEAGDDFMTELQTFRRDLEAHGNRRARTSRLLGMGRKWRRRLLNRR